MESQQADVDSIIDLERAISERDPIFSSSSNTVKEMAELERFKQQWADLQQDMQELPDELTATWEHASRLERRLGSIGRRGKAVEVAGEDLLPVTVKKESLDKQMEALQVCS